jgi:hypothetical protein
MTFEKLVEAYKRKQKTGEAHPSHLYSDPLLEQGVFLLEHAMEPLPCPVCRWSFSQLRAAQEAKSVWWGNEDTKYQCPNCAARLEYHVGWQGEPHWTCIPDGTEGGE